MKTNKKPNKKQKLLKKPKLLLLLIASCPSVLCTVSRGAKGQEKPLVKTRIKIRLTATVAVFCTMPKAL